MGRHKDSLPGGRNPARSVGTGSSRYVDGHQNCHTPGGRYGYRMEHRRELANERAEARAQRTPQAQLAVLDARLGEGQGAKKERARLQALIEAPEAPKKKGKKGK